MTAHRARSPSLIKSPIGNVNGSRRFGRWTDHKAAYLTSRMGY